MTLTVSSALVLDWLDRSRAALAGERAQIDALNVFPVPDGDTGTNLYLTVESASLAVSQACGAGTGTTAEAARAAATGALLGARGNSGVILAQMLRGVGEVLGSLVEGDVLEVDSVRAMLRRAADLAYQSVSRPVEGTMLTVARAAADAADAVTHAGVAATVVAAAEGARVALARTPDQLEALRMAGVVDAGGRGVVVVLEALAGLASGAPAPIEPADASAAARAAATAESRSYGGPAYEVMFLLDADDDAVASLRAQLDTLGDSLVVVGGDRLWNVHVHVDDAGAAIDKNSGVAGGTGVPGPAAALPGAPIADAAGVPVPPPAAAVAPPIGGAVPVPPAPPAEIPSGVVPGACASRTYPTSPSSCQPFCNARSRSAALAV